MAPSLLRQALRTDCIPLPALSIIPAGLPVIYLR